MNISEIDMDMKLIKIFDISKLIFKKNMLIRKKKPNLS